jgi:hypothetical protein
MAVGRTTVFVDGPALAKTPTVPLTSWAGVAAEVVWAGEIQIDESPVPTVKAPEPSADTELFTVDPVVASVSGETLESKAGASVAPLELLVGVDVARMSGFDCRTN